MSRARVAVTVVFATQAVMGLSWIAHIPQLKSDLGLSDGSLGLALLGGPRGAVVAMAVPGWLLPRLGSKTMMRLMLIGYCLTGAASAWRTRCRSCLVCWCCGASSRAA